MAAVPMEIIIGSACTKYEVLSPMIQQTYAGSRATNLNIFVDLTSLLRRLIEEPDKIEQYEMSSQFELSADIVNLCAHYRDFFGRMGVITRFYLIYGRNCPSENLVFCGDSYNAKFATQVLHDSKLMQNINTNLNLLNILCVSLPGVYFFNIENYEVAGFIEHIMNLYGFDDVTRYPDMENMIISKDILTWQLVPRRCTVLRPRKYKGSDSSFIVTAQNMWQEFMKVRMVKDAESIKYIDNKYLSNVLAMTRIPERNLYSIKNIPTAMKVIVQGIEMGILPQHVQEHQFPQSSINYALQLLGIDVNYTTVEMRWKAISSAFAAEAIFPNIPWWSVIEFKDIYDPDGIRDIVSRYYTMSPIDLERL